MRNLTFFAPSKDDLVLLLPRVSQRAKAFAYYYGLDDLFSRMKGPGNIIAEPTLSQALNATKNATSSVVRAATETPDLAASTVKTVTFFSVQNVQAIGQVFRYVTSRWAIVTMVMTIILNRTHFYASSRVPLDPRWPVRLGLYLIPIVSLLYQIQWLTQGIRCQTSPQWPELRYGKDSQKNFSLDYAAEGGFMYWASSALLFWQSEEASCANVNMNASPTGRPNGSLMLLWPLFLSFCLSQFVETFACALQGRRPVGDINLVELSLAFAEAETMVLKPFEMVLLKNDKRDTDAPPYNKKLLLTSMNVAPEMLLISLLWALNNLSSNILAVFRIRHKYRLLNTGFWGLSYLLAFSWSIVRLWPGPNSGLDTLVFRFPTIFVLGFIPHIIVIIGMAICGTIYAAALILTAFSLPSGQAEPSSFKARLTAAYRNLQANVHFSNASPVNIRMTDDFYTTLLATGFTILTAASEAVYLNEGAKVRVSSLTWVERQRMQEIQQGLLFKKTRDAVPQGLRAATNGRAQVTAGSPPSSGYKIERKAQNQDKDMALAAMRGDVNDLVQRSGRWVMAVRLLQGTSWLILGLYAKASLYVLRKMGIHWRPEWLRRFVGEGAQKKSDATATENELRTVGLDFWMLSDDGSLQRATDPSVDVEAEMRRRQGLAAVTEDRMDDALYGWWKQGGWWGDVDDSGEYQHRSQDDDTTSMISYSTDTSVVESIEEEELGRRTPTQENPYPESSRTSREGTPLLDISRLASLLDPQSQEDKAEATLLARRLRRPDEGGPMTRSQYRRQLAQERAAVVTSSRYGPSVSLDPLDKPMTQEEEEKLLEQFIIARRAGKPRILAHENDAAGTWTTGAEGMGSDGPQCVVCQDAPRTILLWPCGCLCLCDDCRVNMATRNFTSCVCCRQQTGAYSRLYVP